MFFNRYTTSLLMCKYNYDRKTRSYAFAHKFLFDRSNCNLYATQATNYHSAFYSVVNNNMKLSTARFHKH